MLVHHFNIFIFHEQNRRLCCVTRGSDLQKRALALPIFVQENESHVPEGDSCKLQPLL